MGKSGKNIGKNTIYSNRKGSQENKYLAAYFITRNGGNDYGITE